MSSTSRCCFKLRQFALQHHWLLPISCHFLRLYSAAGRGIAAVSSAIEEFDLYLLPLSTYISRQLSVTCEQRGSSDVRATRVSMSDGQRTAVTRSKTEGQTVNNVDVSTTHVLVNCRPRPEAVLAIRPGRPTQTRSWPTQTKFCPTYTTFVGLPKICLAL